MALPITVITAIGLASIVAVGAIGGTSPSGRASSGPGAACGAVTGTAVGLDPAQAVNAATITGVALGRGLGPVGAAIGVSVALAESTLFNYANDGTSTLVGSAEGRQLNDSERAVARESLALPHDAPLAGRETGALHLARSQNALPVRAFQCWCPASVGTAW